jgi:hypothetical protein
MAGSSALYMSTSLLSAPSAMSSVGSAARKYQGWEALTRAMCNPHCH